MDKEKGSCLERERSLESVTGFKEVRNKEKLRALQDETRFTR